MLVCMFLALLSAAGESFNIKVLKIKLEADVSLSLFLWIFPKSYFSNLSPGVCGLVLDLI